MEEVKPQPLLPRPPFLSVICIFSFVYFLLLFILFLIALFVSGWIAEVTLSYLPEEELTKSQVIFLLFSASILHGTAFIGILGIWKLKRWGYFLLGIPCLIIASYQLFQPQIAITSTGIYIFLIVLFGLFFRKLH